jgi:MraZ protein
MTLSPNKFIGEYAYSIDAKSRVNIPARFRQALSVENEETFFTTRGFDACIYVIPAIVWQNMEMELSNLSSVSETNRSFIRNQTRHASPSTYDKQGRIKIPASLLEYAGIKKDVTIIGMINKIEIWNADRLAENDQNNLNLDSNSYDDLAGKIIL